MKLRTRGDRRRLLAIALLGATTLLSAACGRTLRSADLALRDTGFADRCIDFMERAYPGAAIKITKQQAAPDPASGDFATSVAIIEGVREKVPAGEFVARDVAVECRFENGILTSFRWLAGPLRPSR